MEWDKIACFSGAAALLVGWSVATLREQGFLQGTRKCLFHGSLKRGQKTVITFPERPAGKKAEKIKTTQNNLDIT